MKCIRCGLFFWLFFKLVFNDGDNFVACHDPSTLKHLNIDDLKAKIINLKARIIERKSAEFIESTMLPPRDFTVRDKRIDYVFLLQVLHEFLSRLASAGKYAN